MSEATSYSEQMFKDRPKSRLEADDPDHCRKCGIPITMNCKSSSGIDNEACHYPLRRWFGFPFTFLARAINGSFSIIARMAKVAATIALTPAIPTLTASSIAVRQNSTNSDTVMSTCTFSLHKSGRGGWGV